MERARTNRRTPRRESLPVRPASPVAPAHPLLSLQQQVGNRALAAALRTSGGAARSPLAWQRPAGNSASAAILQPVQRQVVEAADAVEAPAQVGADEQLNAVVEQQVAVLPEVDEAVIPAAEQIEEARDDAAGVGDELDELGVAGDGPLPEFYGRQFGGDPAAAPPAVAELEAGAGQVERPAAARPGWGARAARWAGEAAAGVKGWFSRKFSRENRRDAGAKGQAVGGLGAPVAGHVGQVLAAGQQVVDNRATVGAAQLVGGAGAAGRVHQTGQAVGSVSSAAQTGSATLEHPAEFARSFSGGGFELVHMVASVVGIFFSAVKAALDLRSAVSTVRVLKGLKDAERAAADAGADPEVIEAVRYAIHQKYEKLVKRALGTAVALAALGAGLAVLIANPAGAALAAVILGGLGAGFFLYKLTRWAWKKWKTKTIGVKRQRLARALFNHLRLGDELAIAAVRSLHLDPDLVANTPGGAALIARKLKSA